MKHPPIPTIFLIILFFLAQIIGLAITNSYLKPDLSWKPLPSVLGVGLERPKMSPGQTVSVVALAILFGTLIFLLILRLKFFKFVKLWFFIVLLFCLHIAFGAFMNNNLAFFLAVIFTYLKTFRNNFFIHNFTELFVYGGLTTIFIPLLTIKTAFILLILISCYDMYAVWKTKHMIALAKSQAEQGVFAGLALPYKFPKPVYHPPQVKLSKIKPVRVAILGGGDIGFPLMFTGTLFVKYGWSVLIVTLFTSLSLAFLFLSAKKNKFYPAMPFITLGCFLGYFFHQFFLL